MPKVKSKRKSTWVDMTAMCDVAFLLLTFFMLTSNFTAKEPIQVSTPSSVSEIKIPEVNVMKIVVDNEGKVFFGFDGQERRINLLEKMGEAYKINFTNEEKHQFSLVTSFGIPVEKMKAFLALSSEARDLKENALGIPSDSLNNQFKDWVKAARAVSKDEDPTKDKSLIIAIKADQNTPFPKIKNVMNTLQELKENRYNLITSLEEVPENL
jgi:biopolymer transport protein ExbD